MHKRPKLGLLLTVGAVSVVACRTDTEAPTQSARRPDADAAAKSGEATAKGDLVIVHPPQGTQHANTPAVPDHAEAEVGPTLGVLIRLKAPPAFAVEAEQLRAANRRSQVRAAVHAHRLTLGREHDRLLSALESALRQKLAPRSTKPLPDPFEVERFVDVVNAIAIYGVSENDARAALSGDASVAGIEPIVQVRSSLLDSVPLVSADQVWALTDAAGVALNGSGIRIGIIDTGVDYTSPDLGGCFGASCKVMGGYDFVNRDTDPMDDHGHGTHVASIAAGNGTYGSGSPIPGIAPGARLYAFKAMDFAGTGFSTNVISAIQRCADPNSDGDTSDHLDVCSLSLGAAGGNPDDAMSLAIDTASGAGVVFTVAAGNSGPGRSTIQSPGTARTAITVGAACKPASIGVDADCSTAIASFSSRGPVVWTANGALQTLAKPDLAAPGVQICATEWGTYMSGARCLDSRHVSLSGTSMATPMVAGAAALVKQLHPDFTPAQVKGMLVSAVTDLGLDPTIQGAGRLNSLAAVNLSGLPSTFASLHGLPVVDVDIPTTQMATFTSDLSITNISSQTLTYAASLLSADSGLTASFAPAQITLAPGQQGTISVTRQIDHGLAPSGREVRGVIQLSTAAGAVTLPLLVAVQDRLRSNVAVADLGVDLASQTSWSTQFPIQITNVSSDLGATYTATVSCCTDSFNMGPGWITATLDHSTYVLAPGATTTMTLTVTVNNAGLFNNQFDGTLQLSSPLQTFSLPVTFFKGYGLQLQLGSDRPGKVAVSNAGAQSFVYVPVRNPDLLLLKNPGPYAVEGYWDGANAPYASYHVVVDGIATDVPVRSVTIDKAAAVHTVTLQPVSHTGAFVGQANVIYRMTHAASGGGVLTMTPLDLSGGIRFRVSDVPSSFNFTAAIATMSSGEVDTFLYELPNGIASDVSVTNTPDEFITRQLINFRGASGSNTPYLLPCVCMTLSYYSLTWGMFGGGDACYTNLGYGTPAPVGTQVPVHFYNLRSRDLSLAAYPDSPAVSFQLMNGSQTVASLFADLYFYLTPTHSFVWNSYAPDPDWPSAISSSASFAQFRHDEPPAGSLLPFGVGPLRDDWAWRSQRTLFMTIHNQHGQAFPHDWNGLRDSTVSDPASYQLFRDGVLVASGSIVSSSHLTLPVAPGLHRWELGRAAAVAGVTTQVKTVSTFTVSSSTLLDENPPALRDLHLVGRGLWQDVLDPASVNRLAFTVDPQAGLLDQNYPFGYPSMPDAVASASASWSSDGVTWNPVSVSTADGLSYSTDELRVDPAVPLYWLQVSATDLAGNTFTYTFQVPRGTGYAAAGTDLTAPTTSITAPGDGDQVQSGIVTVSAIASDNVSVSRVDLIVDGAVVGSANAAPYAFNWSASGTPRKLQTRAYDASGNVGVSNTVSVTVVDATPPSVSVTTPVAGSRIRGTIGVTASAADDSGIAHVDFYLDGSTLLGSSSAAPYSVAWSTPTIADGVHQLTARAYDNAGNAADSNAVSVTVDNTAPSVALSAPTAGARVGTTVALAASASDAYGVARVDFFLDGTSLLGSASTAPWSFTWNSTATAEGAHSLAATAVDTAGNSTTSTSVNVTLDKTAPVTALTAPTSGTKVHGVQAVTATATDSGGIARVEFYIDGTTLIGTSTASPYTVSWTSTSSPDGAHSLTSRAYDVAGNSTTSAAVSISIDNTGPATSLTSPATGATVSGTITLTATATDGNGVTKVEFYRDGTTLLATDTSSPYSFNWNSTSVPDGAHSVAARAYDSLGNTATSTSSITVDNTAPTTSITSPANNATVQGTVAVSASATDTVGVTNVEFYFKTTLIGTDSAAPYSLNWDTTTFPAGSGALKSKAYDGAGHVTTSSNVNVTVKDITAPTSSITSPTNGAFVTKQTVVTISATATDVTGVTKVEFYVNGSLKCSDTSSPYACAWTVPAGAGVSYSLIAKAYDAAGNIGTSSTTTVTSQ